MKTIHTIGREELKSKLDRREDFQIVNVLTPELYRLGAIPGSKKIPVDELVTRLGELDKNREVVVYCAGPSCNASRRAARILENRGFDAAAYEGGLEEWKQAGFPLEGEEAKEQGKPMKKEEKPMKESSIDKELEESFPASDPPSWTGGGAS